MKKHVIKFGIITMLTLITIIGYTAIVNADAYTNANGLIKLHNQYEGLTYTGGLKGGAKCYYDANNFKIENGRYVEWWNGCYGVDCLAQGGCHAFSYSHAVQWLLQQNLGDSVLKELISVCESPSNLGHKQPKCKASPYPHKSSNGAYSALCEKKYGLKTTTKNIPSKSKDSWINFFDSGKIAIMYVVGHFNLAVDYLQVNGETYVQILDSAPKCSITKTWGTAYTYNGSEIKQMKAAPGFGKGPFQYWVKMSDFTKKNVSVDMILYGGSWKGHNSNKYFTKCSNRVNTSIIVTVTTDNQKISSLPVNPSSDMGIEYESEYISIDIPKGTQLTVTEIIENHVAGHLWYHVNIPSEYRMSGKNDASGWFYSNYVTRDPKKIKFGEITITGQKLPSSLTVGKTYNLEGTIKATSAVITNVKGYVINQKTGVTEDSTNDSISYGTSSFDIKSSNLNQKMDFNKFPAGIAYTFYVNVTVNTPYVNKNGELVTNDSYAIRLITPNELRTEFTIGSVKTFTVSFDGNGADDISADTMRIQSGSVISQIPTARREGYTFKGWKTNAGTTLTTTTKITGDIDYYAQWEINKYSVIFEPNNEKDTSIKKVYSYYDSISVFPKVTRNGYTLDGWYNDDGDYCSEEYKILEDTTLTAQWIPSRCYVKFDTNGGNCNTKTIEVTYTQSYGTLPIPNRDNYEFDGWYTAPVGGNKVTASTTVQQYTDHTLYAHWLCEHQFKAEVTRKATCTENGIRTYTCSLCSAQYQEQIPATDHNYVTVSYPQTCLDYAKTVSTCQYCGDSYTIYNTNDGWSEWISTLPAGITPEKIETKTEYRYRDYTTAAASTPGAEQTGSYWVQTDSGTLQYVKSWPSGFSTSHSLYNSYNGAPLSAGESDMQKIETSESVCGYIYYHWCRGTYSDGPINRKTSKTKTSEFSKFHAFYNTKSATHKDPSGVDGGDSYYYRNATCCKDSYWYYRISVYQQNWTKYNKEYTYSAWGEWSAWNSSYVEGSNTRDVESRTLYRYFIPSRGEHEWDQGSLVLQATCTQDGSMKYKCLQCAEEKIESVPKLGHYYTANIIPPTCDENGYTLHLCTVCSDQYCDNEVPAAGHYWDTGIITIEAGEGTDGEITYTCRNCDTSRTEKIPALPLTYTVSYDAMNGIGCPNDQTATVDKPITIDTLVPVRSGYSFCGWHSEQDDIYQTGDTYTKGVSTVLTAIWEPNTYTVQYDANGGTGTPEPQIKEHNVSITVSAVIPQREGYDFRCWVYRENENEQYFQPGEQLDINASIRLIAEWQLKNTNIEMDVAGGMTEKEHLPVSYGESIGYLPAPVRDGYTFVGWFLTSEEYDGSKWNETEQLLITEDTVITRMPSDVFRMRLVAHWDEIVYHVSFDANGGSGQPETISTVNHTAILPQKKPQKTGYDFRGWAVSPEAQEADYQAGTEIHLNADITLYAVWEPVRYTVSFDVNGGSNDIEPITVVYGEAYGNLPVPERADHIFIGWYSLPENGNEITEASVHAVANALTLYAQWTKMVSLYTGTAGDNVTWSINPVSRVLTISGSGDMDDYSDWSRNPPYLRYKKYFDSVVIQAGITRIGNFAFYECSNIQSVQVPDTLLTIGQNAFVDCTGLTSVSLPASLTKIEMGAFNRCSGLLSIEFEGDTLSIDGGFSGCTGLTELCLPAGVSISSATFTGCINLRHVVIPTQPVDAFATCPLLTTAGPIGSGCDIEYGVKTDSFWMCQYLTDITLIGEYTEIPYRMFYGCSSLGSITLPDGIVSIGEEAFQDCASLTELILPESVSSIGKSAFRGCKSLLQLQIPENVTVLEDAVLRECTSLQSITIPSGVTSIGADALKKCTALEQLYIPATVTSIGSGAFAYCDHLKIHIDENNSTYSAIDDVLFNADGTTLKYYPPTSERESYTIPEGVTTISTYAFNNCTNLKNIYLPESIVDIYNYAFSDCTGLVGIDFPESHINIRPNAFQNCTSLTSVYIPDAVLYGNAFKNCIAIKNVTILQGSTSGTNGPFEGCISILSAGPIGSDADFEFNFHSSVLAHLFMGCTGLTSVTLPETVESISSNAFNGCTSLCNIDLSNITYIYDKAFYGCTALEYADLSRIIQINNSGFSGCQSLRYVTMSRRLKTIGDSGFMNCYSLQGIDLPDTLTTIGKNAFDSCKCLVNVVVPPKVTVIADSTFFNCKLLENVVLKGNVTSIGNYAFQNCNKLHNVAFPSTLSKIGKYAFSNCKNFTSIILPDSVISIDEGSFEKCSYIKNIKLSNNLTEIPMYAFREIGIGDWIWEACPVVIIPEGIEIIQSNAFYQSSINKVYLPTTITSIGSYALRISSLENIFYSGTSEQWSKVNISTTLPDPVFINANEKPVKVLYDCTGGTVSESMKDVFIGTAYGEMAVPEREHYSFLGWYTLENGGTLVTSNTVVTSQTDHTLYAQWQPDEYMISYQMGNGTELLQSQTKYHDVDLSLPTEISSLAGFDFIGWSADASALLVDYLPGGLFKENTNTVLYAVWQPKEYLVDFVSEEHTEQSTMKVRYGEPFVTLPEAEHEGYIFDGWYTAEGALCTSQTKYDFVGDITLYAHWIPCVYNVYYDVTGGDNAPEAMQKAHDTALKLSSVIPSKLGYSFDGWQAAGSTDIYAPGDLYEDNCDTVFEAIWVPNRICVNLIDNFGDTSLQLSMTVVFGGTYGSIPKVTHEGHRFMGWALNEDGDEWITSESVVSSPYDHDLYAILKPEEYTITYNVGSGIDEVQSQIKYYGTALALSNTIPVRPGYEFAGWTINDGSDTADYQPGGLYTDNADLQLRAIWIPASYNVMFVDPQLSEMKIAEKTVVYSNMYGELPYMEHEHYEWMGWYTSEIGGMAVNEDSLVNITNDIILYARWKPKTLTVTLDGNGGHVFEQGIIAQFGSIYGTLPIAQREGYNFIGWFTDGDEMVTSDTSVLSDGTQILYAHWHPYEYSVTYYSDGGANIPENQIKYYDIPLTISDCIPTLEGYNFVGWATQQESQEAGYSQGDIYYQNANVAFYAVWAQNENKPIVITSQPEAMSSRIGNYTVISVTAIGNELTYQWQTKKLEDELWTTLIDNDATTDTIKVLVTDSNLGNVYRCQLTDGYGNQVISEETILTKPQCTVDIIEQPKDYIGYTGDYASFSVLVSGDYVSYQWKASRDYGSTWHEITGEIENTLSVVLTEDTVDTLYCCILTDQYGESIECEPCFISLKSSEINIKKQPSDYAGLIGENVIFDVEAEGENLSYQWFARNYYDDDWSIYYDTGSTTHAINVTISDENNYSQYKCVVKSGNRKSIETDTVTLCQSISDINIITQPTGYHGKLHDSVELNVIADGLNMHYQWFYIDKYGCLNTCTETGNNTSTMTVALSNVSSSCMYTCAIWSGDGDQVFTEPVRVSMDELVLSATQVYGRIGDRFTVDSNLTEEEQESVIYKSSDLSIATVDQTGVITLVGEGTVTISLISDNIEISYFDVFVENELCITLSSQLQLIEAEAFSSTSIAFVDASDCDGLIISKDAFTNNSALHVVYLPNDVTISGNAFIDCPNVVVYCKTTQSAKELGSVGIPYVYYETEFDPSY